MNRDHSIANDFPIAPVCVVGSNRLAVTLATQFALKGLMTGITAVDAAAIERIARHDLPFADEPDLGARQKAAQSAGLLVVTSELEAAARAAKVILVLEPLGIDAEGRANDAVLAASLARVGAAMSPGVLLIYEGVLAIGDTRRRLLPILEHASGGKCGTDFFLAYASQRAGHGHILADTLRSPKIIGGIGRLARDHAAAFMSRVMDTFLLFAEEVEDAELVTLMETAQRAVQSALANELATLAEDSGIDARRATAMANSQPYSWSANAGFDILPDESILALAILRDAHSSRIARSASAVNADLLGRLTARLETALGGLSGRKIALIPSPVRGDDPRRGAAAVAEALRSRAAEVVIIENPSETPDDRRAGIEALVVVCDRRTFEDLRLESWPNLRAVVDAKNAFSKRRVEASGLRYIGVGR